MEIRVLRYFLTVAKEQSFTKAAEVLHITQPTLSRQLAGLEKELAITAGSVVKIPASRSPFNMTSKKTTQPKDSPIPMPVNMAFLARF